MFLEREKNEQKIFARTGKFVANGFADCRLANFVIKNRGERPIA
jgi:hypothetical protein